MLIWQTFKIGEQERGLLFRDREFKGILGPGTHRFFDPLRKVRVDRISVRAAWIEHQDLDLIVKAGPNGKALRVLDLADHQRALVWIDGRFEALVGPGLSALWTVFHRVEVEVVDARAVRFEHERLATVLGGAGADSLLNRQDVEAGQVGLYFLEGQYQGQLNPGAHAFWKGLGRVVLRLVDLRERTLDISGQEIMTADKVTLRLNAVVTYKVVDPLLAVTVVADHEQSLYRDVQLALRGAIGGRELDLLLTDKQGLATELAELLAERSGVYGTTILDVGIRDVILPGEMKQLMNQVIEARKAAEATLVTRREETAAMRNQANTARILEANPTLMRLCELEVLEKIAEHGKLNLVVGEKGLTDRVVNLL